MSEPAATFRECERIEPVVRAAGEVALRTFRGVLKSWIKGVDSPVTEADIAVNDLLRDRLPLPGDGWLSEESENDASRLTAGRVWVVDPIDGTRAYMAGREDWSISVALVEAGRPVGAVLFAPVTDEMFLATRGAGAKRNGVAMSVSRSQERPVRLAGPKRILDGMARRDPNITAVPRIHSLALRLVRVATGELDAAIAGGRSQDWDLAAADLLVHEAGGLMTALDGTSLVYNRADPVHGVLLATGRERHQRLIELVRTQAGDAQ